MYAPDFESKCFIDAAAKLFPVWDQDEMAKAESFLRERAEMVRAGLLKCPAWFMEELMQLDSRLRCFWDSWRNEWVIDRFQDEGIVEGMLRLAADQPQEMKDAIRESATGLLANGQYYLTVLHFHPQGEFQLDRKLIDALRGCDMQRFSSPAAYLTKKRAEAEKQEAMNTAKQDEAVLGAVDALPSKSLEAFRRVHEALETGETIIAHGDDAKFLERVDADRRRRPALLPPAHILRKRKTR